MKNTIFVEKNFRGLLTSAAPKDAKSQYKHVGVLQIEFHVIQPFSVQLSPP